MEEQYSKEGDQNLRNVELTKNFTNWLYSILKPNISGTILEVGSGIGTYSEKIVNDFKESTIFLSDADQNYVSMLDERYREYDNIHCIKLNLNESDDYKSIDRSVDTVIASNVLEHVENDVLALENIGNYILEWPNYLLPYPLEYPKS